MGNFEPAKGPFDDYFNGLNDVLRNALASEFKRRIDAAMAKARGDFAREIDAAAAEILASTVLKVSRRFSAERIGSELLIHVQLGKAE
jgi:hypothetical protein